MIKFHGNTVDTLRRAELTIEARRSFHSSLDSVGCSRSLDPQGCAISPLFNKTSFKNHPPDAIEEVLQ